MNIVCHLDIDPGILCTIKKILCRVCSCFCGNSPNSVSMLIEGWPQISCWKELYKLYLSFRFRYSVLFASFVSGILTLSLWKCPLPQRSFVGSCFSLFFHPCEDKQYTSNINFSLFCSPFCTCFLTPSVSWGPAFPAGILNILGAGGSSEPTQKSWEVNGVGNLLLFH